MSIGQARHMGNLNAMAQRHHVHSIACKRSSPPSRYVTGRLVRHHASLRRQRQSHAASTRHTCTHRPGATSPCWPCRARSAPACTTGSASRMRPRRMRSHALPGAVPACTAGSASRTRPRCTTPARAANRPRTALYRQPSARSRATAPPRTAPRLQPRALPSPLGARPLGRTRRRRRRQALEAPPGLAPGRSSLRAAAP